MRRKYIYKRLSVALLTVCMIFSLCGRSVYADGKGEDVEYASRLIELIFGKRGEEKKEEILLCPGGDVFGIKINGVGVTVTEVISDEAAKSFKTDDKILRVDGKEVYSASDVREALETAGKDCVEIEVLRDGKHMDISVLNAKGDGQFRLGIMLSDNCTGIGTLTYYDPSTNTFGGLGHSIAGEDGKSALKMTRGNITGVIMAGARKGEAGKPGELRGVLTDKITGSVTKNTECGVFGTVAIGELPELRAREPIPVGSREDIHEGAATVISTVKSGMRAEFSIEIHDIERGEDGSKCFKVRITDDTLIALTGGIVRGMSGSPIIQDGKLVGAVTHVMVANPTEGYGIFIENMLNAANIPMQKAA
jgi:stage IV sporulation protein B